MVKGPLGVVSLPGDVRVECLAIHHSSGFPVLLGADEHTMSPGNRSASCNLLDDAHFAVLVEAGLDVITPVDWDLDGCVAGDGFGVRVNHQPEWRALHWIERLVVIRVEGTNVVVLVFCGCHLQLGVAALSVDVEEAGGGGIHRLRSPTTLTRRCMHSPLPGRGV